MLSEKRNKKAALRFFNKSICQHGFPEKVTIDKSIWNKSGLDEINLYLTIVSYFCMNLILILVRQIKYLNNIVEQDHRFIKKITRPMLGFKSFHSAESTLSGIELHRMLRKCQHKESSNMAVFEQFYALAA